MQPIYTVLLGTVTVGKITPMALYAPDDVVIGTLGKMIPRMCVVGHTVNLASRLQSSAEANEIQISDEVYAKLSLSFRSKYSHKKREKVDLKHIGLMDTWVFPNSE